MMSYKFLFITFFTSAFAAERVSTQVQTTPQHITLKQFSQRLAQVQEGLNGHTILHVAVFNGNYEASLSELKRNFQTVLETNAMDSTPLEFAVHKKDLQHITLLCHALRINFKRIHATQKLLTNYDKTIFNAKILATLENDRAVINHLNQQIDLIEQTGCGCRG